MLAGGGCGGRIIWTRIDSECVLVMHVLVTVIPLWYVESGALVAWVRINGRYDNESGTSNITWKVYQVWE